MPIGPPATGKGRAMRQGMALLKDKVHSRVAGDGRVLPTIYVCDGATSLESLYEEINKSTQAVSYLAGTEKRTVPHHSIVFLIEELGVLLRKNSEDTVSFLSNAFDCGDVTYKTRHKGKFLTINACANILAATYPEFIRDNPHIITQGFTSRVIIIYENEKRFKRYYEGTTALQEECYNHLRDHMRKLSTVTCGEVVFSDEAAAYIKEVYPTLDDKTTRINKDIRLDHYYGRKNIHVEKLAMILHFSESYDSNIIEVDCVRRALVELNKVEVRMHEAFKSSGKNLGYEVGQQIVRYLEHEPKGASYKRLLVDFTRDIPKKDFDETLIILQSTDQIHVVEGMFKWGRNGK